MPKVEKQSGYTFFYESQQIDIKQKVSLNGKNETIKKTIAAVLKGTNVKFEIDATHIILYTGKNNKAISCLLYTSSWGHGMDMDMQKMSSPSKRRWMQNLQARLN